MTRSRVIYFADRHYDAFPGRAQAALLKPLCDLVYIEEDYAALIDALRNWPDATLAFNSILGTPGNLTAPAGLEEPLRNHINRGAALWILHGGSAAFWPWSWWRQLMPLRWVRNADPDNPTPSIHPVVPFIITPTAYALEQLPALREVSLPTDEIYIRLAAQHPFDTLLSTCYDGVIYPQAYSARTPSGGALHGFLPGHKAECLTNADYISTFTTLAGYWLRPTK